MKPENAFCETPLELLTDYYQLTMAYAAWKSGRHELPAVFHLYFRSHPFHGGYTVAAGLAPVLDLLERFEISAETVRFLSSLKEPSGKAIFEPAFLEFLAQSRFTCDVWAVPEGTIVFPQEPLLKVRGPLWQCQWIETALLNLVNFQSLIATKAARMVEAARGGEVVEMGLRRAQGFDGSLSASRAAYIGGCSATSSLLASLRYGIPLRGTQAHSWVMSFDNEQEAFDKYAEAFPNACVLLVDTYDTLTGIERAIETGKKLRARGGTLAGIRLDSGDFAYLSAIARERLDREGFNSTRIIASNELDENLIQSLRFQEAKIDVWGVGTKLVTAQDQPAMSGVYKLAAVFDGKIWRPKIKVSDQPAKTSNPGVLNVRRYFNPTGGMEGDLIYDDQEAAQSVRQILDPVIPHRHKPIRADWKSEELLAPVFQKGTRTYVSPSLDVVRARVRDGLSRLHAGHKRLENPHIYPVGLSPYLAQLKADLMQKNLTRAGARS